MLRVATRRRLLSMQNRATVALLRYVEQTYGPDMWRRLATATTTVPSAMRMLKARRFVASTLALPLALVTTALTVVLAGLMLINVGYPLRQVLGLGGHEGNVWASTYYDAWGGPTLLGAWAVHAMLAILLLFPLLGWAIRDLVQLQLRLARTTVASPRAANAAVASGEPEQPKARRQARTRRHDARWRSVRIASAAFVSVYALALLANTAGIGDNVVWVPRDVLSSFALIVVLSPLAAALMVFRTGPRET